MLNPYYRQMSKHRFSNRNASKTKEMEVPLFSSVESNFPVENIPNHINVSKSNASNNASNNAYMPTRASRLTGGASVPKRLSELNGKQSPDVLFAHQAQVGIKGQAPAEKFVVLQTNMKLLVWS